MRGSSRFIRILLVLAVGLAWTLSLTPQQAAAETKVAKSAQQVYTETGTWAYNGRTWVTNCTKYSTTVDRCETKIWGTQVTYANGKFTQKSQWVFNNLTYLTSPRSTWETWNPLVTPGEHTINGRKWRTQCDTPWTGRNGCRSEIWATIAGVKDGKFQNLNQWVFNNIVHVTPVSCPVRQDTIRDIIADQSIVTDSCLQSKVDPNWLAVQYVVTAKDRDGNKDLFMETAFFNKKPAGWGFGGRGGLHAASICTYYEDAGVPHDLADTVSYCFPNG
ncbi:hypothetical protein LKO27_04990 [Tessaracoccus sp. OS52]|uniref:hypothetical protein n=1 Tax=Tessaracoccus sp. OS52 TaxID=2886691 RepID=UPI001D11FE16|nr:hypothetical protein [Tessaracoccus sp. OS52]MCC2592772.1 hypothetical protein [Tessaracoccus sp. OS52]